MSADYSGDSLANSRGSAAPSSAAAVPLSDPASKLIYVLQHNLGWTAHRVSMRLNIPLMVVEECSRTGRASEILRHQLRNWLREEKENNTLPSELPSRVVHAVLNNLVQPSSIGDNDTQGGGGAQSMMAAVDLVHDALPAHGDDEDQDESFQSLDPLSRHHFDYLRKTVGCNFVSIITDPNDRRTAGTTTGSVAAWDWVENTVTSLLDDTPEAIARRRLIKAESVQDLFNLHPVTRDTFGPYLSYITPSYKSNWAEKQKMLEASSTHQGRNAASGSSGSASKRRRTQQYSAQVRASQSARILPSNHPSNAGSSSASLPWPDWVPEEFFDVSGFSLSTNLLQKLTPLIVGEAVSNNAASSSNAPPQQYNASDEPAPPLISKKEWDRVLSSTTPPPVPTSLTTPLSSQQLTEEIAELELLMETIDGNMEDVNHCLLIHVLSHSEEFFHASQELEALSNNSSTTIYDLRDTRTTVVRSGESVVGRFMQTLKLHRQRMHLQTLITHLDTLKSFLFTCRSISMSGDEDDLDSTSTGISKVVTTLQGAMKMRFKGDTSDTLADLKCIGTITTDLLNMHQQLQESVVRRCGELLHPSTWSDHPIDWDVAGDYINAARECGTLRAVITRFQQNICDYCWEVVEEEISRIGGSATSPVVDSQQRFSAEGDGSKRFSSGDPRAKRALLAAAVVPLKPQRYIHFVTDVTVRMSYYHSDVLSQCDNLLHCLGESYDDGNEGGGESRNDGDSLDVEGLRVALLHSIQVVLIDVIECREAENAAMVFFDMMQLIRHVFQFVGTLQAADAAPSHHRQSSSKSAIAGGQAVATAPSSSSLGPLKAALASQARALFRKEHDRQQEKMLLVLGQETWVPNETVEQAYQRYCDLLCNSTPEAVAEFKKLAVDSTVELSNRALQHAFGTGRVATEDSEHFERKVYLTDPNKSDEEVVEQGFMVTTSLLLLLHSLYDYDRYLAAFPFLAPDVAMKIHDALKLFDGQCAGLVLGAGAVAQGTLDSISVQNLAVASQCTGFLIELAARIKLRLAAVTSGTAAGSKMAPFLKHLDRVQKDLTEHRNEYMAKVAAMVREKIDSTPFEPAQWSTSGSAWVMMMLKETARAHKHVKVVVRRADQQGFMVPIVGIVAQRLVNAIQSMPADALHGCRSQIRSDLALVEANTVKFGYNAPLCMDTRDVGAALSLVNTNPAMDTKDFMRTFHPSLVA